MESLELKQVKQIALDILIYIDKICKENDLNYAIFYGTLLGAVRHKGFIPWDDDIDIVMLRPDYDKLIEILSKKDDYLLLNPLTRENYRYTFSKLVDKDTKLVSSQYYNGEDPDLGIFVDIFPLDGLPNDPALIEEYGNEMEMYRVNFMDTLGNTYARSFTKWKSLVKRVMRKPRQMKLLKQGNFNYWRKKYDDSSLRYPIESSQKCGHLEYILFKRGVFPTAWFSDFIEIEFEGYRFQTIKNFDDFLSLCYGDYMKLPPIDEQQSNHLYKAYYK
ncbi:LicD family protein [Candidatus Enterococcus lemimoniae]|uniref:Lipopolysaccharide cholinephosphotransferase n=1 Tax=Candidatus Enterococcus lemimoniae TaxID=1834167 RepID=A0ABZ2T9B6_9ENTE|nr:LicD family protein [Enterococcus sp. 12C11_DIV0727]OTO70147.1 hypothetical protein A5866_002367 [Enterococcus sp. 12C11_DIV0727]